MNKTTQIWVWAVIIGVVLILAASLLFLGNNTSPSVTIDLDDPNIIGIAQGTEGSFDELEIGVTFVDADSAGIAVYSRKTDTWAQNVTLYIGHSISYSGYEIELLDTQESENTAFFQVHPIE